MSEYRKTSPEDVYFVTLTVEGWIDVFIRDEYRNIIIDNLKHCQQKEDLEIFSYVLMTNHLHMITRRRDQDLTELLGRFKSYTAKKILKAISINNQESRKEWMLNQFSFFAKLNKQYKDFHFWHYTNHPTPITSVEIFKQKEKYIHENPVRAGFVLEPHHWLYSSACEESPLRINGW